MMARKQRIHRANVLTAEQSAKVAAIREQLQKEKPSLDDAVASGQYLSPITMGDYFDIAALLAEMKSVRVESGMSLRDCAADAGVDFAALSRLENGVATNPTVNTLARCARALGRRIQYRLVKDRTDDAYVYEQLQMIFGVRHVSPVTTSTAISAVVDSLRSGQMAHARIPARIGA